MRKLFRRIHFLLHRKQLEAELAEEMAAHREMMPEGGRGDFGHSLNLREDAGDVWGWIWLDHFWQDIKYALRTFRRSPAFTFGAVSVLALGVGANLAEFHVMDAVILHSLNVNGADSIFLFRRNAKERNAQRFPAAAVDFYRKNCTQCAFVLGEKSDWRVLLENDVEARVSFVSGNFFSSIQLLPAWGRLLDERDARPGAPAVAVLGYQYWRDHEGADPNVIDRIIHISGKPVQIVGVTPYDFAGLQARNTTIWLPIGQKPALVPDSPSLESYSMADEDLLARPRAGASLSALEAELTALTHQLASLQSAQFQPEERVLGDRLIGTGNIPPQVRAPLLLLFGLVILVFLSACANLANMLLARGMTRQREIDIRIALGAGRGRVVRQLVTESLLLSALGAVGGLVFGYVSAQMLLKALGAPPWVVIAIRWPVVAGAAGLTLFSALAFGLPSALQVAAEKHKSGRRRRALVGVQVAISSLLLICSGILVHNAIRNAATKLNFDYRKMVVVYPGFAGKRMPPPAVVQKLNELRTSFEGLPGVDAVTLSVMPPLGQRVSLNTVAGLPSVYTDYVAPNYFEAMKVPVVRGRSFRQEETDAVIVSESAARTIWPNQDPIGKSWDFEKVRRTVVGVVKDTGTNLLVDSESIEAWIPIEPVRVNLSAIIVHTNGEPAQLMRTIPSLGAETGQQVAVTSMAATRANILDSELKTITLLGSIGLIATVLAAAGMFAMVAFAVAQRTREIGIRMAIGARPRDILRTLLDQNCAPVFIGTAAGTVLGVAVGRIAKSVVNIVENPLDPLGFIGGVAAFLVIAALATLSPALKALRIDPSSILRSE